MKKRRVVFVSLIIACFLYAVFDYYSKLNSSYKKYLSGEYFFREKAQTINIHANDNWWATDEAQSLDYGDPKNMLKVNSGLTVYVSNPHDGLCTVWYGKDTVIEDYPLADLELESKDTGYFYGTKQYTLKEYKEVLGKMSKEELKSPLVSDRKMAGFVGLKQYILFTGLLSLALLALAVFFYIQEMEFALDLTLILGAGYSVLMRIIIFYMNRGV